MKNENKKDQNPAPEVSDNSLEGVVGGNGFPENFVTISEPGPEDVFNGDGEALPHDIEFRR